MLHDLTDKEIKIGIETLLKAIEILESEVDEWCLLTGSTQNVLSVQVAMYVEALICGDATRLSHDDRVELVRTADRARAIVEKRCVDMVRENEAKKTTSYKASSNEAKKTTS